MKHFQYNKLKQFYHSEQGIKTTKAILQHIEAVLPENIGKIKQLKMIGVGFCDYLMDEIKQKLLEPQICIFHPQNCGAIHYQQQINKNSSVLVDEAKLPLRDDNIDIAIIMHSLEFSEKKEKFIAELARILVPMAYAFIIIPDEKIIYGAKAAEQIQKQKIKKFITQNKLTLMKTSKIKCQSPYLQKPEKIFVKIIEESIQKISPIKTGVTIYNIRKITRQKQKANLAENIKLNLSKISAQAIRS